MELIKWAVFIFLNPVSLMVYYLLWKQDDIERSLFGSSSKDNRFKNNKIK